MTGLECCSGVQLDSVLYCLMKFNQLRAKTVQLDLDMLFFCVGVKEKQV